jgi:AcrR family transcriptional regulator
MAVSNADPLVQLSAADAEELDPYAERILDAAYEEFVDHGLRRTSMDDIARRAGVGRATLFRRFAGRDALVRALVAREVRGTIAVVDHEISSVREPEAQVTAGFLAFLEHLRAHPLLQRLLVTDPAEVLPLLTTEGEVPLAAVRAYIAAQLERTRSEGASIIADPDELAELLARLALSFVLTPGSVLPLDDAGRLPETVRTTLVPLILGRSPADGA